VLGGELTDESITMITNSGTAKANNGGLCGNDLGVMNIFVYSVEEGIVSQNKISEIESYRMTPSSIIPPGDCIIIEFGPEKDITDKICKTYEIALEKGDISYGS